MSLVTQAIVPVRSRIAALISRFAPHYYKQIIEHRHPGVLVVGDATSDVRSLKETALQHVLETLKSLDLLPLATIDDRNCWIVLADSGSTPESAEQFILDLLDRGLRITVYVEGRRPKRITTRERLERLKQKQPFRILSIRAGNIWMRERGCRQVGWHAAARVHLYDWDDTRQTYRARSPGNLPPMIDPPPPAGASRVTGLSTADTRLDKVRFPIDVVYTWVNGNDPTWNEKRQARAVELGRQLHKVANSQTRYINRDELRYSLRSLYYYAPWIRQIFLVTDDQVPAWYDPDSSVLKIISHRDLFPDENCLPTFNSHAIESVLHRIPGLSEHFLYMNDDVFFSSVVHPEAFFEINGIARTFLSRAMIPFCGKHQSDVASEWGVMNANELLLQAHGALMPYKTKHTPIPLRKTLLSMLETRFSDHFDRLRRSPFRTTNDLAPTSSLHACFGLMEGMVVRGDIAYRYLNLARPGLKRALQTIAYSSHSMVYCLNDTEIENHGEFDWDYQEELVTSFLKMMYPYQAPWEKTE